MKPTIGNFKVLNLVLGALALTLFAAPSSYAREQSRRDPLKREFRKMFNLGVCVGQDLATQGVTLPARQPGQPAPVLDASTQGAVKGAIEQCWAQMRKVQAGNQPSTTPAPATPPAPTTTPATGSTATPVPTVTAPTN